MNNNMIQTTNNPIQKTNAMSSDNPMMSNNISIRNTNNQMTMNNNAGMHANNNPIQKTNAMSSDNPMTSNNMAMRNANNQIMSNNVGMQANNNPIQKTNAMSNENPMMSHNMPIRNDDNQMMITKNNMNIQSNNNPVQNPMVSKENNDHEANVTAMQNASVINTNDQATNNIKMNNVLNNEKNESSNNKPIIENNNDGLSTISMRKYNIPITNGNEIDDSKNNKRNSNGKSNLSDQQSRNQEKKEDQTTLRKISSGKECRQMLYTRAKFPKRVVPAFTYESLQQNTIVLPPKKINLFKKRPVKETFFSVYLKRGDIPVATTGHVIKNKQSKDFPLRWFCPPEQVDYCYYLPIFIDGLSDSDVEIRTLAQFGAMDLIYRAPHKIMPVLPKIILPFKRAFNTRDKKIIVSALKVLQAMVRVGPCLGQALVPYFRQLLAVCNLYKNINVNLGQGIDMKRDFRIGDVIADTLSLLEGCGGPNAYINIKYMIPTYESSHPDRYTNKK